MLCNSHIKWGELLNAAEQYNCDFIATGHYAQIEQYHGHYYLKTAVDQFKDQTYFLWMLTEENLKRTIFPLGGYTKQEVRELAQQHKFEKLARKSESQEICFIPDNDYRHFLAEQGCKIEEGNFVNREGKVVGRHKGFCNYTIGQRKGLGVAFGEPKYVTHIDADRNEVTIGDRDELYCTEVHASKMRIRDEEWLRSSPEVYARIRYKSPATAAKLVLDDNFASNACACLHFTEPVWGVTPGQSLVLYKDGLVVGGGLINS